VHYQLQKLGDIRFEGAAFRSVLLGNGHGGFPGDIFNAICWSKFVLEFFHRNGEGWRRSQAPALTTCAGRAQRALVARRDRQACGGLYYSGKRTREWLKFKTVHEQQVVIVGYTEPRRSRKYFGSLVLAVRDKANKRHVGTGFDQAALKSLYEIDPMVGKRIGGVNVFGGGLGLYKDGKRIGGRSSPNST
jgi:hypothetical protein